MVDPSGALQSFQKQFLLENLKLEPGAIYANLYVHYEEIGDSSFRLTYVRLKDKIVIAFVNIVPCAPFEGTRCFQIGYAVPDAYRNRGVAKETIEMAITEMKHGYLRAGIKKFYIEAIVDANNSPSRRVAEHCISANPTSIVDENSGLPAFQYLRKIES
jgi:RimJ/RimL family protein N-acetyltransferase